MARRDYTFQTAIIIGNGFDLNLGLKTSYNDFLNSLNFDSLIKSKNNLAIHLKKQHTLRNWIDIENELKTYSNIVDPHQIPYENEFENLSNELRNYLTNIDYNTLDKNAKAYELIKNNANEDLLIFDFNYTNTIKTILSELNFRENEIENRLIKVHGSIENSQIIFGIEDNAPINPEHVFLRKAFKNNNPVNIFEKLNNINNIHIFGHSLGETDHTYFKRFFDEVCSVNDGINEKKIFLYHHGPEGYKKLHMQLDNLTNNRLTILKQENKFKPINIIV